MLYYYATYGTRCAAVRFAHASNDANQIMQLFFSAKVYPSSRVELLLNHEVCKDMIYDDDESQSAL